LNIAIVKQIFAIFENIKANKMILGTKIRKLRIQKKWSQEELAFKLNVGQTTISNFESSKTIPDFLVMLKVCEIFDIGLDYFIENDKMVLEKLGVLSKTLPEGVIKNILKRIELLEKSLSSEPN
jgi:transcriptional regulator with XRE-family HTH domain